MHAEQFPCEPIDVNAVLVDRIISADGVDRDDDDDSISVVVGVFVVGNIVVAVVVG